MTTIRHQLLQYGLALSLSLAAVCFLSALLMQKTDATATAAPAAQTTFAVRQSPKRISVAVEQSVMALGWEKKRVTVTATNTILQALTAQGRPVRISVMPDYGTTTRIHVQATGPAAVSQQLTQQLHEALLLALR